jgi:hypothetical protein
MRPNVDIPRTLHARIQDWADDNGFENTTEAYVHLLNEGLDSSID